MRSEQRADGTLYLDYLTWDGPPKLTLTRPDYEGQMWRRAWVNGLAQYHRYWPEPFRLIQNEGRGLLMQGTRDWTDYKMKADVTPHLVKTAGIAVRVQGMRRFYALLLSQDKKVRLVKALDGDTVLAETDFDWYFGATYNLALQAVGHQLVASIDGQTLFKVNDSDRPLTGGGVALVCEEGRSATQVVAIEPV